MKVSVSLSSEDVEFLDTYAQKTGEPSRSAVVRHALGLLRAEELEDAYAAAWREWAESDDAPLWDRATGDGVADAAR